MTRPLGLFAVLLAFICVCQADEKSLLVQRLRELLGDNEMEKREFYNVVRSDKRIMVNFVITRSCEKKGGCTHTVRMITDKGNIERYADTNQKGIEIDTKDIPFNSDVMIQVCENLSENCRYAFLQGGEKGVKFSTSKAKNTGGNDLF